VTAFGIAQVRSATIGPDIARYLQRIDSTLAPFGGRFLAHGAEAEVLENDWEGQVVILEFPDLEHARGVVQLPGLSGDSAAAHPKYRYHSYFG
jgi:uncharacterized protein (DUF1330 family)